MVDIEGAVELNDETDGQKDGQDELLPRLKMDAKEQHLLQNDQETNKPTNQQPAANQEETSSWLEGDLKHPRSQFSHSPSILPTFFSCPLRVPTNTTVCSP